MADYALPALVSRLKVDTSDLGRAMNDTSNFAAGLAGVLAVGVGAVVAFGLAAVKHAEDAGQAAFQMKEQFGLAGEQASAWLTVSRHLGVDAEKLSQGFKNLAKNMETLNLKGGAADAKALDAAHKQLEVDTQAVAKAHQHLADVQAILKGKTHLTIQEQISLRDANQAVIDADAKLAAAHTKLQEAQQGVSLQNVALQEAFTALGVPIKDAQGNLRSLDAVMLDAADAFAKMPDGAEKTGLAMKIFGKSGQEMLPILNQGRKGIEDMMKAGKLQGDVMSNDQVEAAHKLFLAHQKLDAAISGLTNTIGIALMPIIASFIGFVTDQAAPAILAFAKPIMAQLVPALIAFATWLATMRPALEAGWNIFSKLSPFIAAIAAAWALWNVALIVTEGVQAVIIGAQFIAGLVAIISKVGLLTAAQWLLNIAMDANPVGLITLAIAALVAGVIWAYQNVGWFRDGVNALWDGVKRFAAWVWSDMKPTLDFWIQAFKDLWDLAGKVGGAIGSFFGGSSGGSHPAHNPRGKAAGGPVLAGQPYTVGEMGPELFVPKTSGMIVPYAGGAGSAGGTTHYNLTLVGSPAVNDPEGVRRMLQRMQLLGAAD